MTELHRSGHGNIDVTPVCKRSRSMCFTQFGDEPVFSENMSYLCYSPEVCPTTGRKHYQGYVYWKSGRTVSVAAKEHKCTFIIANGTPEQNRTYCGGKDYTKDGKVKLANPLFKEFGLLPQQGKRHDLNELKDEILNGKKVDEILLENPEIYHQYGRTLTKTEDLYLRKQYRTEMTTAEWIYGPTGVGKSHKAFENFHPDTHYVVPNDNGWWDGYTQQETVILNDFRGNIPYNELLQLIDKWPHSVKRRNREPMPFTSKHIIITSSLSPQLIYHNRNDEDSLEQLLRRCTITNLEHSH